MKRSRRGSFVKKVARRGSTIIVEPARVQFRQKKRKFPLGTEVKFVDRELDDDNVLAGIAGNEHDPPTILCLNGIGEGDGESEREGRKVILTGLHIKGAIRPPVKTAGAAPATSRYAYICVVLDTQTNKTQMSAEDCFVEPTNANLAPFAFRVLKNVQRFKVLWSKLVTLNYTNSSAHEDPGGTVYNAVPSWEDFTVNLPLQIECNYTGTGDTIASIMDNSIHVLAFANEGTPVLAYTSRIRFVG